MDGSQEMIGDIIARLIEGDMLSGEQWRPAATLDFLVQALVGLTESDDDKLGEVAKDILGDILISMTYLEIHDPESDAEEIDQDVLKWREILDRIDRPNDPEEKQND